MHPAQIAGKPGLIILSLPLIAALIGWLTNYVAVKMLFHPREPFKFLFINIQGVFPKRQKALANKLGKIVSNELFSVGDVVKHLKETANSKKVLDLAVDRVEEALTQKLPQAIPMLALVLTPKLVANIRVTLMHQIKELISELTENLSASVEKDLDVHAIVEEKVSAFSSDKLEELLYAIMEKEFRFIELVGAVLGFGIGLLQVGLLYI